MAIAGLKALVSFIIFLENKERNALYSDVPPHMIQVMLFLFCSRFQHVMVQCIHTSSVFSFLLGDFYCYETNMIVSDAHPLFFVLIYFLAPFYFYFG